MTTTTSFRAKCPVCTRGIAIPPMITSAGLRALRCPTCCAQAMLTVPRRPADRRAWARSLIGPVIFAVVLLAVWALMAGSASAAGTYPAPRDQAENLFAAPPFDGAIAKYKGRRTGLYHGSNQVPAAHAALAPVLVPRDIFGNPDPNGVIIVVSLGMSNTRGAWNGLLNLTAQGLNPWIAGDVVQYQGAKGGQTSDNWIHPFALLADQGTVSNYDRWEAELTAAGFSMAQVAAVWVKVVPKKVAFPNHQNYLPPMPVPGDSWTYLDCHNARLTEHLGLIARSVRVRCPNVAQLWVSSRTYAGHATTLQSPEPYAYESAFGVRDFVTSQVDQLQGLPLDPAQALAGDLSLGMAPWVAWGPYLWDQTWPASFFLPDGTHPTGPTYKLVGGMLRDFFVADPITWEWYVN